MYVRVVVILLSHQVSCTRYLVRGFCPKFAHTSARPHHGLRWQASHEWSRCSFFLRMRFQTSELRENLARYVHEITKEKKTITVGLSRMMQVQAGIHTWKDWKLERWRRGCRRNSYLQAARNTWIARTRVREVYIVVYLVYEYYSAGFSYPVLWYASALMEWRV